MSPEFLPMGIAMFGQLGDLHTWPESDTRQSNRSPHHGSRIVANSHILTLGGKDQMNNVIRISVLAAVASGVVTADEITDWNQMMLLATLTAPVTPAPVTTRVTAIVQAAVFDAVNGIDRHYSPIFVPPAAAPGTSKRAAAVQAAYATLVSLYPAQKAKFDQQRAASLAAIADTDDAVKQGLSWGQNVADQILAWRSHDGFSDVPPPYLGGTKPGQWRPTPPAMAPGLVPQLATTTPWVIRSPSQFRTTGPVALTSDQYTADFNEVKNMGGSTNSGRTADQTLLASFWQVGNPPDYWDPVVTSLAAQHHFSMSQTARLLALVNLGMADAAIGCWDAKYTYSWWRPITAIQAADTDGNDATNPDPAWTPLIVTPPFPEYPSAHSCVSGAAARILSESFGEETSFKVVSNAMPGVTRNFHSFSAALEEVKNARVLGGIHFRTACVDGTALGIAVGDYIMSHAFLPLDGGHSGREH
jgi:PAP2 superfamily